MFDIVIVVAVIIGVVEAIKRTGFVDSKWSAVLAIVLGVAWAWFSDGSSAEALFGGVIAGLTAAGLFSGAKATLR